jgi:hypothetical protein
MHFANQPSIGAIFRRMYRPVKVALKLQEHPSVAKANESSVRHG